MIMEFIYQYDSSDYGDGGEWSIQYGSTHEIVAILNIKWMVYLIVILSSFW